MRDTSENLPKPSKNPSPGTKNQNSRENLAQNCPFFEPISGVATPQPSGSNPDGSSVAQWLNMRITPASCLPAPASRLPGLCLPASASRGPFRIAARTGVGGKPRAAGEVVRNHNIGPNSPPFKNPCPAQRWGEAPCGAGGFQKSQYWPKSPSIQNPCPGKGFE